MFSVVQHIRMIFSLCLFSLVHLGLLLGRLCCSEICLVLVFLPCILALLCLNDERDYNDNDNNESDDNDNDENGNDNDGDDNDNNDNE